VTPFRFLRSYGRFKGVCCFHAQGQCSLTRVYQVILYARNYNKDREKLHYVQSLTIRPTSMVFVPTQQQKRSLTCTKANLCGRHSQCHGILQFMTLQIIHGIMCFTIVTLLHRWLCYAASTRRDHES
jgi:hypothetical protein